jgi:hypothetical protein
MDFTTLDVVYSLLLNLFPLVLFGIPVLILQKKKFGVIYRRLYYGLCIFFLVYWVLPSLLSFSISEMTVGGTDYGQGFQFIIVRTLSMVFLYAQYPFYILPFVFVISPVFSLILLSRRLKKETGGSISEKLNLLNYEFTQSPRDMIMESLKVKGWDREKEIFKAFAILLPISLYLLTVILDIAGLEAVNVNNSSTALGWFIEILFCYLATFLFGYQIIKSSKISYKGRFIGEQLQSKLFSSISEVGTPISVLSILLFVAQASKDGSFESLLLVIFFFAYFLMAAFIFIILLRVFEPISIIIFIKMINWWKKKSLKEYKPNYHNAGIVVVYAIVAGFVNIVFVILIGTVSQSIMGSVPDGANFLSLSLTNQATSFEISVLTDILTSLSALQIIGMTLIYSFFFKKVLKISQGGISIAIFGGILLIMTIALSPLFYFNAPLLLVGDLAWTTGAPIGLDVFGFNFFTMRTAFLTSDLTNNPVLLVLAFPFLVLRTFVNFILWGYLITFIDKRFRSKTVNKENNFVERITFSDITHLIPYEEFVANNDYLIISEKIIFTKDESDDLMNLFNQLKEGMLIYELKTFYKNETERLYTMLKYLSNKNYISFWVPEFSYSYEKATLDGLYILYTDGRDLLYHNFHKGQKAGVDPALVSGMFSAITSFIHETTKSSDLLRSIDSGDKKVILEYSETFPVFGALFADRETTDIRLSLKKTLADFDEKHRDILGKWNGRMDDFANDLVIVEQYFAEFM